MEIILNGKKINVNSNITLFELLRIKKLKPERIIIEYNFKILHKENWGNLRKTA